MVPHLGGRRFDGLVGGQASHASTSLSSAAGLSFTATLWAVFLDSKRRSFIKKAFPALVHT